MCGDERERADGSAVETSGACTILVTSVTRRSGDELKRVKRRVETKKDRVRETWKKRVQVCCVERRGLEKQEGAGAFACGEQCSTVLTRQCRVDRGREERREEE